MPQGRSVTSSQRWNPLRQPVTPTHNDVLFGNPVFIYQVLAIKDRGTAQYRTSIQSKLADLLKQPPFSAPSADFSGTGSAFSEWYTHHTYLGMVAAIDMFFNRFP